MLTNRKTPMRTFKLSDEDYTLLTDYAHANRITPVQALRYLIRTGCSKNGPPHDGIALDDDARRIVQGYVTKVRRQGRMSGDLPSQVVNHLIRHAAKKD